MRYSNFFFHLLCLGFLISPVFNFAQSTIGATNGSVSQTSDTTSTVEILGARKLEFRKVDDSTQLQILAGNVRLKQGTTLFYSDSCIINNDNHSFEAWGHVHINDSDTADAYSNHLLYLIKKRMAYLDGAVRLTDGHGTLTAPDVEYDMNTKVGTYKHGGKVINNNTILTSREGYYYTDLKDVYFKNKVELNDPAYYIKTDSLLYNTELQTARFIAETFIRDSSGRIIETKDGIYNMQTGKAEFGRRPIVHDKNVFATGNEMINDDSTGMIQFKGNAIIIDSLNQTTIIAGEIFINKKSNSFLALKKPLLIVKQDKDSLYITADTLFSARLSDLPVKPKSLDKDAAKENISLISPKADSSGNSKKNSSDTFTATRIDPETINATDSTNRYFEAYRNVRIFSDSMQAVCDSLFYSFQDSIFRLYDDPVLWSKESQISGDTILLFTKNKKADRMKVINNSLFVNKLGTEIFNQVMSRHIDAFFKDGAIDSVHAVGSAECIYFIVDEDSAYSGINESKSDILDAYFNRDGLQKVVFRSAVTGTLWPIRQKNPKEMRLSNFKWMEAIRPKTKFELY